MFKDRDAAKVFRLAQKLLENGDCIGFTIRMSIHTGKPIPVLHPSGEHHSWFVPVVTSSLLAGFFEFGADLTFMRYSSFQKRASNLTGCPTAAAWIDEHLIQQKIERVKKNNEKIKDFFLSYDGNPSHLAWRGILESDAGTVRSVYVAGNLTWECNDLS